MSARRPRVQHRLEYALVLGARMLDRVLGPRVSSRLAGLLGRVVYHLLRIRRDVVEAHLRQAFPVAAEKWIRGTAAAAYAHLGREGMSMLRLSRLGPEDVVRTTRVDGLEPLESAMAAGRGAILVTGHVGNWEIGGAALAARGVPLDVVARRQGNPLFDELVNRARERLGMRVIEFRRATKESLRSLRAGRAVALVADQDARRAGIFVPFLGRPASTFRGPAVLALRSGAPVFIGTALRRPDGGYDVRIRRVPVPSVSDPEEQARELTAAFSAELEAVIRADPGQYLWHHRRWKTAPPAASGGERADAPEV